VGKFFSSHGSETSLFWSKAPCPVDLPYEAWTYLRLRWLLDRFGADRLLARDQFLPSDSRYAALTREPFDVTNTFELVCDLMGVRAGAIAVEVHPETDMPNATGMYFPGSSPAIWIVESHLNDREGAVATLAHEVAHHLLLGPGHLSGHEPDHEQVTDLLTACLGFGVFAANSTIRERTERVGHFSWWEMTQRGYLSAHIYGWVLAVVSWLKDPATENEIPHLRLDARESFSLGLKHLRKHGLPAAIGGLRTNSLSPLDAREVARQLRDKRDANRLISLRVLMQRPEQLESYTQELTALLGDPHAAIRAEACIALANLDSGDAGMALSLADLLHDRASNVRIAAATCLGRLMPPDAHIVHELVAMLEAEAQEELGAAAQALGCFGALAAAHRGKLLLPLENALIDCNYATADLLITAFSKLSPAPADEIASFFDDRDPELKAAALHVLCELHATESTSHPY
jgi:hypothetical protein